MIHYRSDVRASGVDARALKRTAARLLSALDEGASSLSLTLVDDMAIRRLNRLHRGKDEATDVLSFTLQESGFKGAPHPAARPLLRGPPQPRRAHRNDKRNSPRGRAQITSRRDPERLLGDVVISVETARRQAAAYDATLQNEVYRLLIHGLLHVLGHDHQRVKERASMEAEERRLADEIGMLWPYETNK